MFKIDLQNVLQKTIAKTHGLDEKELNEFVKKHEKSVQKIFKNKSKEGYGFLNLPDNEALVRRINRFVSSQKKEKWEHIVVLGIGGSALGLIATQEALMNPYSQSPKLHVVDNVDPVRVSQLMDYLKLNKTLFVVISKSGGTVEPMALYGLASSVMQKKYPKKWQKHFVFITDPKKGLLRPLAGQAGITAFDIPPTVGGRFSVLSSVGLVPAALVGVDIAQLLKGAKKMRDSVKKKKGLENLALSLSAIQYLLDTQKKKVMTVMMPYSTPLFRVGDWYRQLLAESLGKNLKTGPTPIAALGTTDQHSQIQLYREGPNNKFLIFLTIQKPAQDTKVGNTLPNDMSYLNGKNFNTLIHAAHRGTSVALAKAKRPNLTLALPQLNEENLGALFMLLECQVALLGKMYGVNAFDQPGVEAGKVITKKILSQ